MSLPEFYLNNDAQSFAFSTCRERWPKILRDAIETVSELDNPEKVKASLSKLLDEINEDGPIVVFAEKEVQTIPGLLSYNKVLSSLRSEKISLTWHTAPWLFTECYLYRRIDAIIKSQYPEFDVFHAKKQQSFKTQAAAVQDLASRYRAISEDIAAKKANVELLFREFLDICLWGNKIDLSLLANKTQEEVHSGQNAEERQKAEKNILANDSDKIWAHLSSTKSARVDIVLDNAGFETYTDLLFMLFLLTVGLCETVTVHCKTRPWMVSDTMKKDIDILLADLVDEDFFPPHEDLKFIHDTFAGFIKEGKMSIVDLEFWTLGLDYTHLDPEGDSEYGRELYKELASSTVVFIKGDLNYRKLTADRKWPKTTKFSDAIGRLAHNGIRVAALRTCKADVCVGLPEGVDEELCKLWAEQTGEEGALWCSSGNWAVISFN